MIFLAEHLTSQPVGTLSYLSNLEPHLVMSQYLSTVYDLKLIMLQVSGDEGGHVI